MDRDYWTKRYHAGETSWDIGSISPPLKAYFDQLKNKSLKILIPGCGNAYEAEYLFMQGFRNVFLLDISNLPLQYFLKRIPDFPKDQTICEDFFEHQDKYDLVIEQTFFCALPPKLRAAYAAKVSQLLSPKGKLVGLLFDDVLHTDKPPYGGNAEEYRTYFSPYFNFKVFERSYNSIQPRMDRELFINLIKK